MIAALVSLFTPNPLPIDPGNDDYWIESERGRSLFSGHRKYLQAEF